MYNFKEQQGMGLIEVMVALLLLAIAVLGFSAIQMQAIKATDESLLRGDAMSAMRNLSEDIRLNPDKKGTYKTLVNGVWTGLSDKTGAGYCTGVDSFKTDKSITATSCSETQTCNADKQAEFNAYQAMKTICDSQLMLNAVACPGTSGTMEKLCLIVSWNDTLPEMLADSSDDSSKACTDEDGSYRPGSNCLVLETY